MPRQFTVIAILLLTLPGCKIQLDVPENGRITSISGNYHCEASQTCEIDVVDGLFNETFVAQPAQGYIF